MKTNEVPEKIIHNGIEYYRVDIIEDLTIDGKTFVKKDAFIEKAKEFIWSHTEGSDYHVNYVLKEFENFMKGE